MTMTKKTKALTEEPVPVPPLATNLGENALELNLGICQERQMATT
jgi:hypothetical protein